MKLEKPVGLERLAQFHGPWSPKKIASYKAEAIPTALLVEIGIWLAYVVGDAVGRYERDILRAGQVHTQVEAWSHQPTWDT